MTTPPLQPPGIATCLHCGHRGVYVTGTWLIADGRIRRRKCAKCARQWRTVERVVDEPNGRTS